MLGIGGEVPWIPEEIVVDPKGWYVIMQGMLNEVSIVLVGLYATNDYQVKFWNELFPKVHGNAQQLIMLGDFNTMFSSELYRSKDTRSSIIF